MNLDAKPLIDEPEPAPIPVADVILDPVPEVPISDDFVSHINSMTSHEVTPDVIRAVIAAQNLANSGCNVGTVRRNDNGAVAVRVCRGGVPMWAVVSLDGGFGYDTQPSLPWTKLADPIAGL